MLSIAKAAEKLNISRMTLYRLIKEGKIKAVIIGKTLKVSEEEVERIKKEGTG